MFDISRRQLMIGAAGAAGVAALGGLSGCSRAGLAVGPASDLVRRVDAARRTAGQKVVSARLTARPTTVDLAGTSAPTWGYNDSVPGPLLRARAGDLLRIRVDNRLPADTSVHWHGLAVRNDMDGVPGMTQDPIASGSTFTYEFTTPHPGTYFYHPHSGMQLDRGLYGALIIDDPAEPGRYDHEWVVVLDDWVDGTGRTPDQILVDLRADQGAADSGDMGAGRWAAWTWAARSRRCSAAPATWTTCTTWSTAERLPHRPR